MTASEYERLYIKARNRWPSLIKSARQEIKAAYVLAAETISRAVTDTRGLTAESLDLIAMQLRQSTGIIQEKIMIEIPALVSSAQSLYGAMDESLLSELFAGSSKVTAEGIHKIIVGINNRLIADTVNRMYQDGYTLSTRVWNLADDYQTQITRLINSGFAQGLSVQDISRSIGDYTTGGIEKLTEAFPKAKWGNVVVKNVDWRALRLVRTEFGASMKIGAVMQGEMNPASTGLYDWVRINTQQHFCLCGELAAASPYTAESVPAQPHPNCHPSGTMVLTPGGDVAIELIVPGDFIIDHNGNKQIVEKSWASFYEGEIIKISGANKELKCTPDHPVLLNGNWVFAKSINSGDNITNVSVDIVPIAIIKNKPLDSPPELLQESSFFVISEYNSLVGNMPFTAIDLDGKFYIREADVNIVSGECVIRDRTKSSVDKSIIHNPLISRPEFTDMGLSYMDEVFVSVGLTSDCVLGILPGSYSSVGSASRPSVLKIRRSESMVNDVSCNRLPSYPQFRGYHVDRHVLVAKKINNSFSVNNNFSTHGTITIAVASEHYKGYVYNLTVENTHTFIANGFASHNCMCQVRPILRDLKLFAADVKRWNNGESVPDIDRWYQKYYLPSQST